MTTGQSSSAKPGAARGRGVDVLFEGSTSPSSAPHNVDADLASLLDDEVLAAETGEGRGVSARGVTAPSPSSPSPGPLPALESVDLPPVAAEAQPVNAAGPDLAASPPAQTVEPERRLPITKRFGAIIMDSATELARVEPEGSTEALAPVKAETQSLLPPDSGKPAEPIALPAAPERTEDQSAIIIKRLDTVLDKGWQRALHQQIDGLYKQVTTEFSSPPENAERALALLREARQVLIETPDEYVAAEYRTMQVRAMLDRVQASRKQSVFYGPRILAYEAGWLLVLLLGLIFAAPFAGWLTRIGQVGATDQAALLNIYPILNTMLWGGLGGVVGALYSLWWHISDQQDFDRHYLTWYWVQPLLGTVLGGIVFLLMAGGFLLLQVNLQDSNASTAARLLPYLTAVLAGFRQNFVYEQFNRLISLFAPASRSNRNSGEGPSA